MRTFVTKPVAVVLLSWLAVLVFAAWFAYAANHRFDIHWGFRCFLSTVLGPLSAFLAPSKPSLSELIFSLVLTLALFSSGVWLFRSSSNRAATAFITLTGYWLLVGLGITYAGV